MIQTILENHETIIEDIKHVFYSNSINDTLFISFAGKIPRYVSVTWFYNQSDFEGNFLFLKNNEGPYNTYNDERYMLIIQYYIAKLNIKKIITYGPSMGGIASISYGLKLNADVIIAIDPKPYNYNYNILLSQIRNYKNNNTYKNKIYINYTFTNNFKSFTYLDRPNNKRIKI